MTFDTKSFLKSMGCCGSKDPHTGANKNINKHMAKVEKEEKKEKKLLLLGTGGSGKSVCTLYA